MNQIRYILRSLSRLPRVKLLSIFSVSALLIITTSWLVISRIYASQDSTNTSEVDRTLNISGKADYQFPIKDDRGNVITDLQYHIDSIKLQKQIIIKGQNATAIENRVFLVVTLKLTNNANRSIEINSRDYLRLIINNNQSELLAGDIHNDPVQIQPISTKYTRIAFPIDSATSDIQLQVGEINGSKTNIRLN